MSESAVSPRQADRLPDTRAEWLGAVLAFWISAAILTGFLHGVELLVARHALGQLAWFSREFAWMSPLAYALVMAPGVALLALLAVAIRQRWVLAVAAASLVTVGAFGLLLPYSQISRFASLVLALGVGVGVARGVKANPALWIRRARACAVAGIVAIVVMAPGQRALRNLRESRAVSTLPAADTSAPNVLVIILDTVRAASMGLYSPDSTTPRLSEWSRSATVFDWAFSPSPWTLPSHGSMFTGAWANDQSGDWERPLDQALPTLAERFGARGYHTGAFVANMHYTAWDSGLPRGFARYEDYVVNGEQLVLSSSYAQTPLFKRLVSAAPLGEKLGALLNPNLAIDPKHRFSMKRGDAVSKAFLDWQASRGDRPFFAFLNYFDAHQPYYAPPAFQRFGRQPGLDEYRGAIAFLDAEIDRVLVTLRERGQLDRTLVVVTSDHGELFAFKGMNGHAHNLYLNTIRVPLLIRFPGHVPGGRRVSQPVTLRDLAATVTSLTTPDAPPFPGSSLEAAWNGAPTSPALAEVRRAPNIDRRYPTSRGDMQSLLDDRWQLIRNGDGLLELYEYRSDSLQERNLATDTTAAVVSGIRQRLRDLTRSAR